MTERTPIPKSLRFEVFKRDSFTCQYCGAIGGQVLLHCDHVKPVAEGGETTLLNLITACVDCNLGKGARPLSDDSALSRQHRQLADLEERRQQLEMMRNWREDLARHKVDQLEIVRGAFDARSKFVPSDHGNISVSRWLRKYGLHEVLAAIDETFDLYYTADTKEEWEAAFKRIPKVLSWRQQEKTDPHIRRFLYIQGILRNRLDDERGQFVERLREAVDAGFSLDVLELAAKGAHSWDEFVAASRAGHKRQQADSAPPQQPQRPDLDQPEEPETYESWAAWDDPGWHIEMFSRCLGDESAARFVGGLARCCMYGGYIDDEVKISRDDARLLSGLYATGLIVGLFNDRAVYRTDEHGNIYPSFRPHCLSPREATNAFNRFGALRLGFWGNPVAFAPVAAVH